MARKRATGIPIKSRESFFGPGEALGWPGSDEEIMPEFITG
jgi:hypothetical protein